MSQYAQSSHGSAPPIGIDLGTTMSAVAVASRGSGIHTIRDAEGRLLTPSVVHLGQRVSVGEEALAREQTDPGEIADAFKRDMGKAHYHRKLRDYWTPPEVLSAFVLEKLRRDAERELGPVRSATIAVPAYFDEPRRQGTLAAGRLAGFEHVQIINEPTAAALAHFYSCGKRDHAGEFRFPDARIVVFDLGGGTLDVSVLQTEGNAFRTLATDGAVKLGGLDFDKCIVEFVASQFEQRQGFDPRTDPTAMRRLWRDAQEAKHSLSSKQRATVSCRVADLRLGVDLSREQFEQLIERYMVVALQTCQEALQRAGLTWGEVDDVLLVGGSSRVPMVARRMEELSGRKPLMVGSPDEAVAQGAAIFAATQVDGFLPPMEIVNVNAHSLGIAGIDVQTNQPINKILIPRNTPLPTSGQYRFVTKAAGQPAVTIRLLEGESENPKNCTTVAHCAIELESNLPARTEILVTCCYGSDGVISTSAFIPATRQNAHVEISREGLTTGERLDVWRTRLTTQAEPEAAASVGTPPAFDPDTSSVNEGLARLDYLASQVGQAVATMTPPVSALACQRALHGALREQAVLKELAQLVEKRLDRSTSQHDRMIMDGDAAVLRMHQQQVSRYVDHMTMALGRECIAAGFWPEELAAIAAEHKRVDSHLCAAIGATPS